MNYPEYCYLCDENIEPTPEGFITHIESARHNLMFRQKGFRGVGS